MKELLTKAVAQIIKETGGVTNSYTLYSIGRSAGLTCSTIKTFFINDALKVRRGAYDVRLLNIDSIVDSSVFMQKLKSVKNGQKIKRQQIPVSTPPPVLKNPPTIVSVNPDAVSIKQKTFSDVDDVFIPLFDDTFVAWGEYKFIKKVVDSRLFCPIYISGLSGNGKTMMVEQACAASKREYVRVQISPETDESELIGNFRLVDGETVFYKGPVIKAMERGAVLLIDELDRGSNKIMCLQGVLEGNPVLIKKLGQVIYPEPGFTIFATANTKGRGSEDGRFSAANIIDEAFIERFTASIEQPYASLAIERNIVLNHMRKYGVNDLAFADKLVNWSLIIRKTYADEGVDELISTRRLCHIVKIHSIINDRLKSIEKCIARFDADTRSAFSDLYSKIDAGVNTEDQHIPPTFPPTFPSPTHI